MKKETQCTRVTFVITVLVACAAVLPNMHAVVPPPDGAYPGGNTAEGQAALFSLTLGAYNTAAGFLSLRNNMIGSFNTAVGAGTLLANTADGNTATGTAALLSNFVGFYNTAHGALALLSNTTGGNNTAIGYQALTNNIAGNTNIAVGAYAGANLTGSDNIDIGNAGVVDENSTIRIGTGLQDAIYLAGIAGQTVGAGGTTCYVDNNGKLGVFLSARRYKQNIQRMDDASAALFSLKPVTFCYKPEFDKSGTPQFGLIAEEVAEISPDLVTHNSKGEVSTVRYEAVNVLLLNEFLKEHRAVQDQGAAIVDLKKEISNLAKTVKEQATQIDNLSAHVEMREAASHVVCLSAVALSEGGNKP